jgi:DNA-binding GntR family transcriptional regulator
LTSREGYEQGYQFRASIEPEAILLPTFKIDKKAFREAREEQQFLLDGGYKRLSRTQVFQANSVFHEMLVACACFVRRYAAAADIDPLSVSTNADSGLDLKQ